VQPLDGSSQIHKDPTEWNGGPDLSGAWLARKNLSGFDLTEADLRGTHLSNACLDRVRAGRTNLPGAILDNATFDHAYLAGVSFDDASLSRAMLDHAMVLSGSMAGATLVGASLRYTSLIGVNLVKANFEDAFMGATVLGQLDLRPCIGLHGVRHGLPSVMGVDTIVESRGEIPEVFLRGVGLPDSIIAYTQSLALSASPIDFYSCFVSHASADQELCERLHNDLQAAGVRCWLASEDLKIGDRFRDEIETAIKVHDKLLLVLSKDSVASPWVESEVENALERERLRHGTLVLFPIRLDDAVMDSSKGWAADIRRTRHIGDFTQSKDLDAYRRAFKRLLRDLTSAKPET
jgi:hypothetical protein